MLFPKRHSCPGYPPRTFSNVSVYSTFDYSQLICGVLYWHLEGQECCKSLTMPRRASTIKKNLTQSVSDAST